jgi:hypothetical protein
MNVLIATDLMMRLNFLIPVDHRQRCLPTGLDHHETTVTVHTTDQETTEETIASIDVIEVEAVKETEIGDMIEDENGHHEDVV